jgi:hypothetical protein
MSNKIVVEAFAFSAGSWRRWQQVRFGGLGCMDSFQYGINQKKPFELTFLLLLTQRSTTGLLSLRLLTAGLSWQLSASSLGEMATSAAVGGFAPYRVFTGLACRISRWR